MSTSPFLLVIDFELVLALLRDLDQPWVRNTLLTIVYLSEADLQKSGSVGSTRGVTVSLFCYCLILPC
jgi:hypothetical protein